MRDGEWNDWKERLKHVEAQHETIPSLKKRILDLERANTKIRKRLDEAALNWCMPHPAKVEPAFRLGAAYSLGDMEITTDKDVVVFSCHCGGRTEIPTKKFEALQVTVTGATTLRCSKCDAYLPESYGFRQIDESGNYPK